MTRGSVPPIITIRLGIGRRYGGGCPFRFMSPPGVPTLKTLPKTSISSAQVAGVSSGTSRPRLDSLPRDGAGVASGPRVGVLPHGGVAVEGVKERIVGAAVRLFSRKGFHATSVREICSAAGVAKPALYYYFRNKEDLFHSIVDGNLQQFRRDLLEACAREHSDFRAQLNAIARVYTDASFASPDLVRFINSIAFSGVYDELFNFHDYWMGIMEMLEGLFAGALRKGWVRDDLSPRSLAFHFNGVVLSVMRGLIYFPRCLEDYPLEEGIAELVLNGLAPISRGAG